MQRSDRHRAAFALVTKWRFKTTLAKPWTIRQVVPRRPGEQALYFVAGHGFETARTENEMRLMPARGRCTESERRFLNASFAREQGTPEGLAEWRAARVAVLKERFAGAHQAIRREWVESKIMQLRAQARLSRVVGQVFDLLGSGQETDAVEAEIIAEALALYEAECAGSGSCGGAQT